MTNQKYQLLNKDYIDIKHPTTKAHTRLYRIIALRDITPDIKQGTIGGYVASEKNLDVEDASWVSGEAKIFDEAFLTGNSIFSGKSAAYGKARVHNTVAKDTVRVFDSANVTDGVLSENIDIFQQAEIFNTTVKNAAKIFGQCKISNSTISKGAVVHGNAILNQCLITDVAEARGTCDLFNVQMFERAIVESGEHRNCSFSRSIDLNITQHVVVE